MGGRAIVWMNHPVASTGVVSGHLDIASLHSGCDVLEGEKIVANQWVLVSLLLAA